MIWYDSHNTLTLLKFRGSVVPKSFLWAVPPAILAFFLRWLEDENYVSLDTLNVLSQGDVYSGFTFVLAFSIVFRTSQAYLRYWTAATSVHEMSCEWSDACAGLIAFSSISKASEEDIHVFRHTVVRLFSLLHAVALTEVADIKAQLPLLDIDGLSKAELVVLTQGQSQGKKVQIVLSWIKAYIVQMGDCGFLNVPAPILTRIFQELASGLVNYHKALQIVIWPFPFPITQLNLLVILMYSVITPMVISTWETDAWVCAVFTLMSVTCVMGLELIACELENPFGEDANDIPVLEMQKDMNKFLTLQLCPSTHTMPTLQPNAEFNHKTLVRRCASHILDSSRSWTSTSSALASSISPQRNHRATVHTKKFVAQSRWRGVSTNSSSTAREVRKLQEWLHCHPMNVDFEEMPSSDGFAPSDCSDLAWSTVNSDRKSSVMRHAAIFEDTDGNDTHRAVISVPSHPGLTLDDERKSIAFEERKSIAFEERKSFVRSSPRNSSNRSSTPSPFFQEEFRSEGRSSGCRVGSPTSEVMQDWSQAVATLGEKVSSLNDTLGKVLGEQERPKTSLSSGEGLPRVSPRSSMPRRRSLSPSVFYPVHNVGPELHLAAESLPEQVSASDDESDAEDTRLPPSLPQPVLMKLCSKDLQENFQNGGDIALELVEPPPVLSAIL